LNLKIVGSKMTLLPALYKNIGIGPSVSFPLKKKTTKLTVCHLDQLFYTMWHTKRQNCRIKIIK